MGNISKLLLNKPVSQINEMTFVHYDFSRLAALRLVYGNYRATGNSNSQYCKNLRLIAEDALTAGCF